MEHFQSASHALACPCLQNVNGICFEEKLRLSQIMFPWFSEKIMSRNNNFENFSLTLHRFYKISGLRLAETYNYTQHPYIYNKGIGTEQENLNFPVNFCMKNTAKKMSDCLVVPNNLLLSLSLSLSHTLYTRARLASHPK